MRQPHTPHAANKPHLAELEGLSEAGGEPINGLHVGGLGEEIERREGIICKLVYKDILS